jgi:hypothetical protein
MIAAGDSVRSHISPETEAANSACAELREAYEAARQGMSAAEKAQAEAIAALVTAASARDEALLSVAVATCAALAPVITARLNASQAPRGNASHRFRSPLQSCQACRDSMRNSEIKNHMGLRHPERQVRLLQRDRHIPTVATDHALKVFRDDRHSGCGQVPAPNMELPGPGRFQPAR